MRPLQTLSLVACLVVAASSFAQDHPNEDHGFKPDKMYSFTDLDHINTFNGNLVITLPIGQKFQVSPMLSYGFSAVYNSNIWDRFYFGSDNVRVGPSTLSNAGAGWSVSLGRFLSWKDPAANLTNEGEYLFITPDGSKHPLYFQFPIPKDPIDSTWKSYDSTYIFLTGRTRDPLVHMPDGTKYFFSDTGDRIHYRLSAIFDRFGNWVNVQYPTVPGYSEVWKVEDSQGHKQTLYFNNAVGTTFPQQLLDRIELEAFGGKPATWKFNYGYRFIQRPPSDPTPGLIKVAFLREIVQPGPFGDASGPKYSFTVPGSTGLDPDPSYDTSGNATGRINAMQLPTKGWIEWDLDDLQFPVDPEGLVDLGPNHIVGVQARRHLDRDRNPLGEWKYFHRWGCGGKPCLTPSRWAPCWPDAPKQLVSMVQNPDNTTLVRYFHLYFHPNCWESPSEDWMNNEYALPLTSFTKDPEARRLSWELRTGVNPDHPSVYNEGSIGTGTVLQTYFTHWHMIYALGGDVTQTNRREQSSRTVFNEDKHCGTSGTETCYKTMSKFDFIEDFGLYRQESEGGNFPNAKFRTKFTNYDGTLNADKDWILGTYTEQCSVEEDTSRIPARVWDYSKVVPVAKCSDLTNAVTTKFKFDRSTGVMDARRTLLGSALHKADLLTTFTRDTKGNITYERFYGGDTSDQQLSDSESTMFNPPTSAKYELASTYIYDGSALTKRQSKYTGSSFLILDEDYDRWTGMVKAARDAAGIETSYTYDTLGRLQGITEQTANGQSTTLYIYSDAASASNAVVTELATIGGIHGTVLSSGSYEYDGLGRLKRTSRLLPNDKVSVVQIDYDSMGRKSRESQPAEYDKHPFGKNVTGYWTSYSYDSFGRPSSVTNPDGGGASFSYLGARESTRSKRVASSESGNSLASTTETYDAQGRLIAVTEDSGDTRVDKPQGDSVTTSYTYDVRGNLTGVSMGTQTRTFEYDGRGFLTRETGPEAGATVFSNFDAKGHALQRTQGGHTLTYVYDAAERLTHVKNAAGDDIKRFDFATANSGAGQPNGKLIKAIRRNELPTLGRVEVTETYEYLFPSGQMSKRSTLVEKVEAGDTRTTLQQFDYNVDAYDDFGQPKKVRMPTCVSVACEGGDDALASITNTRKAGFLTSVDGFGQMTYHASGMTKTVQHATKAQATDKYDALHDMPRPSRITFQGCANTKPYFLPGAVLVKGTSENNSCGLQITWPAAVICGGASNIKYKVLRDGVPISGCETGTKFVDTTAVKDATYTYTVVAEGPAMEGGSGACQSGFTITRDSKPFTYKSCPTETLLSVRDTVINVGASTEFEATLESANGPVQDEFLTFSVLGQTIGTARTNANGKAFVAAVLDVPPKLYDEADSLTVTYAGGIMPARTVSKRIYAVCTQPSYSIRPLTLNVMAHAASYPIFVRTSSHCTWDPSVGLNSFYTFNPDGDRKGTGTFNVDIEKLEGSGTRHSEARIAWEKLRIEQSSECSYEFDPQFNYFQADTFHGTATATVNVSAPPDCKWKVRSDANWLRVNSSEEHTGSDIVEFTITDNEGINKRVGHLLIDAGAGASASINQAALPESVCPEIHRDIEGGSVENGQNVAIRVDAEGTFLHYEWWINNQRAYECRGCSSVTLAPGMSGYPAPGQSTSFQVRIFNTCGEVTSKRVTWTNQRQSCKVPSIADSTFHTNAWPADHVVGSAGSRTTLRVVADGWPDPNAVKHQWYRGFSGDRDRPLTGPDGYGTKDEVQVGPGFYWVEVTNACGSNQSRTAQVFVFVPPSRPRPVRHSFDGDNHSDVVWQNPATSQVEIWKMNAETHDSRTYALPNAPTSTAKLQSTGDLNADGHPDLIWRDPETGQNQAWMMRFTTVQSVVPLEQRADKRWTIGAVADFDGDNHDDVAWHNAATGANEIWFHRGTSHEGTWALPNTSAGIHGAADFNGDQVPDLFLHDRTTGQNNIWAMREGKPIGTFSRFGTGTDSTLRTPEITTQALPPMTDRDWIPAFVADMDGNGKPDILWRNVKTGENKVWIMNSYMFQEEKPATPRDPAWDIAGGGSSNSGDTSGGGTPGGGTATSLQVTADPATAGTATAVTATLKAGTTPVEKRPLVFLLNNTEVTRLLTDATGEATAVITLPGMAAATYPNAIKVRFDGDTTYSASSASTDLVITTQPAAVTWLNPASIVYGTALGEAQLNATASVPGTFVYSPPAGTILNAGYQTLSVTFTPNDTTLAAVTKTALILVNKASSSVAWAKPVSIAYGTPLSDIQLNATSSLAGDFTYDPAPGSVLAVGNGQVLRVTFEPESPNYAPSTASTTIDVTKGAQSIRWSAPAPITYPMPLGEAQLNATVIASGADPAGALAYTPPAGTVLAEGVHALKVMAAETASYLAASLTLDIVVNRKTTTVTWNSPDPIPYGAPLSATQLNATATVPGTFVYTPAAGSVLDAGTHYLSVKFTPAEAGVDPVSQTVTIRVLKVKPTLTYPQPAPIVYGTPLSSAQLNATSNVAGSFTYDPPAGTILTAGTHEILASFIPADTRNYESAAAAVVVTVTKAPQTINWSSLAAIVYGTALSSTQLNATVSVAGPAPAGALTYTPPAGTLLQAGAAHVLTVNAAATPNYEPAAKSVTIDVLKATPLLTWPQPAPIVYKTLLGSTQLNATANVPGMFVYTPPSGTLLQAGTHTLSAQFTPSDTHNYNNAAAEVTLEVQRANPLLNWTRPAGIVYGTPLGASQLNATADVAGTFTYTPAAGTILDAGERQTLSVRFRPDDTRNYNDAETSTTIDVTRAKQTIVWSVPPPIVYGTPLSSTQLNARAEVVGPSPAGALMYTPPAGTVLDAGTRTLTVDAAETRNYEPATASVTLQVNRAPLSLAVAGKSKLYGGPVPALTGVLTGVQNNDPITPSYATTATQASPTGVYAITATLLDPNNRLVNYDVTITPSTLTINPAPLLIAANAATKQYSDPVPLLTATYTGFVLGETPAVLSGSLLIQTTAERLSPPGVYPITIGGLTSTNYVISYAGATLTELPEDARVQVVSPLLFSAAPAGPTTITLAATIRDISATADANGDGDSGDIRKASLTFVDRATDTVLCTAPIGLTVATDERTGIAICTFTRDFGTAVPATIVVASRVGAYYTRDAAADYATLSIAAPTRDHVTAAGALNMTSSSGPEAPDANSTARFEFNQRYDNKGLVQGRMVLTFSRTVNGQKRDYELAPAAIGSMAIQRTATGGIAAIVGTGTLRDVTSKSKPIVIAEAAPLVVTATDGGQPAASDSLSFTLYKPDGGLWMATGWDGIRAVETPLQQGAVGVHPGN